MTISIIMVWIPIVIWIPIIAFGVIKYLQLIYNTAFRVDKYSSCGWDALECLLEDIVDSFEISDTYSVVLFLIYGSYVFLCPLAYVSAYFHGQYYFVDLRISYWWLTLLAIPVLPLILQMLVDLCKLIGRSTRHLAVIEEKLEKLTKDLEK